jgi:hypothetical protein
MPCDMKENLTARMRIPTMPAGYSDLIPATVPI